MHILSKQCIIAIALALSSSWLSDCAQGFAVRTSVVPPTSSTSSPTSISRSSNSLSLSAKSSTSVNTAEEDSVIRKAKAESKPSPKHENQHEKSDGPTSSVLQRRKREWINQSLSYYATVSREAKRRENGQFIPSQIQIDQHKSNFATAKKLYFARHKIKKNQPRHAERIYRKLIDDLLFEQEQGQSCDHAQIAISTLLLALLLQRQGQVKETRATFVRFFRLITMEKNDHGELKECTCSAKVLQAFALFEMKQRNPRKAYNLAKVAIELDNELEPVLQWKQFRDAKQLVVRK